MGTTAGVDTLALLQSNAVGGREVLGPLIGTFLSLALVTSIIGFTYGLVDAWTDVLSIDNSNAQKFQNAKAPLFVLIYVPPLALALVGPSIFYQAFEYGVAFGVSTLFLVLPLLMV